MFIWRFFFFFFFFFFFKRFFALYHVIFFREKQKDTWKTHEFLLAWSKKIQTWNTWWKKYSSLLRDEILQDLFGRNFFQDFLPYTKISGVSIFVSTPHCYYPSYSSLFQARPCSIKRNSRIGYNRVVHSTVWNTNEDRNSFDF